MNLSPDQQLALDQIQHFLSDSSRLEFRLGGYAGTGKSTIIKQILTSFKLRSALAAFTGKAVHVLQKKGNSSAQTLHSLLYDCISTESGTIDFVPKHSLEGNPELILVDEASMVSTELYDLLKSHGKKILFVGDPGQLEPVGDNPNLMRKPDFVLSTIHRQGADSGIVELATQIRESGKLPPLQERPGAEIRRKAGFRIPDTISWNQIIVATNKTRAEYNSKYRMMLERPMTDLRPGDKLIVLRNNRSFGVFNGVILFVESIKESRELYWLISAKDEMGKEYGRLPIWKAPFQSSLPKDANPPPTEFRDFSQLNFTPSCCWADFAYAITCHKSQGSEWDRVLVWAEPIPYSWSWSRWAYTAVTRAAKEVCYCV